MERRFPLRTTKPLRCPTDCPADDSDSTSKICPSDGDREAFRAPFDICLVLIASLWVLPTSAVFIDFQNCLSEGFQNDTPLQLQFDPLYMNAVFNTANSSHNLNITVWGNVTGSGPGAGNEVRLPAWNDTYWGTKRNELGRENSEHP